MQVNGDKMDVDLTNNGKRKMDAPSETKLRKKKNKGISTANKTAVQLLNEQFPGTEFTFAETGSTHSPSYQVVAEIKGVSFEGNGPSKGTAKRDLATNALARLLNIILPPEQGYSTKDTAPNPDTTQTKDIFSKKSFGLYDFNKGTFVDFSELGSEYITNMPGRNRPLYAQFQNGDHKPQFPPTQGFSQLSTNNQPTIDEEKARSHPVMVLSEVFPDAQLDWLEGAGKGGRQFKVEAEVKGRKFFGEGRSKKIAKLNLAKTILLCMYDIHDFKEIETATVKVKTGESKFPITQLKELIGEDMNVDVIPLEETEGEEKRFHATIVVKGVAYEAIGKTKKGARIRAAKKALDVLKPKKDPFADNTGLDTSKHPTMVFSELFHDIKFDVTESKGETGFPEYLLQAKVEGRVFKALASSKKKAKLRLILDVFEVLKNIPSTEWSALDIKDDKL